MPKGKQPKTYEVTGRAAVLGYACGDQFSDVLSPDQEQRLVDAGSIKIVTAPADDKTPKE
jgi:hypothetical protein